MSKWKINNNGKYFTRFSYFTVISLTQRQKQSSGVVLWKRCSWVIIIFFYQGFLSRTLTHGHSQDSRGREETIFHSTLPLPPAHEHSDIYLQLCTWDYYHIFLIAPLVFTRDLPPYRNTIWLNKDVTLVFI